MASSSSPVAIWLTQKVDYDEYCDHPFAYLTKEQAMDAVRKMAPKNKEIVIDDRDPDDIQMSWVTHRLRQGRYNHYTTYSVTRVPMARIIQ